MQTAAMAALRRATHELSPSWRASRDAAQRIQADHDRIALVLAAHPHPYPANRDPKARANAYTSRISQGIRDRRAVAEAAHERAAATMQGRGRLTRILATLGIHTPRQRHAVQMMQHAMALTVAVEGSVSADDYAYAQATGEAHAYAAQRTTRLWESSPDVMKAVENARLNVVVQQAVTNDDPAIQKAMHAGDPEGARAIVRTREAEQERQAAERERLADLAHGLHGPGGARLPTPGGP